MKITFKQQAEKFLADGRTRKRNPLRPATLRVYKSQIETILNPALGGMLLQTIGNKVVGELVQKMSEQGYSARTITLNVTLIKKIRKSAINDNGDVLYPYSWASEVIDAPEPKPVTEASVIAREALERAIYSANVHDKALYALLAGTGLRIAEARAIQAIVDDGVSSFWDSIGSRLVIRQQMTRDGLATTKTDAGQREVDLAPELNNFLIRTLDISKSNLMFPGKETGYLNRLKKNGIDAGFHAFRRFRVTHLNKMSTPTGLEYFWTGHSSGDAHSKYIRFGSEIETRKSEAARVGLGFELPNE